MTFSRSGKLVVYDIPRQDIVYTADDVRPCFFFVFWLRNVMCLRPNKVVCATMDVLTGLVAMTTTSGNVAMDQRKYL